MSINTNDTCSTLTYHSQSVSECFFCPRKLEPNQAHNASKHHSLNQFEFAEYLGLGGFECPECQLCILGEEAGRPFFLVVQMDL